MSEHSVCYLFWKTALVEWEAHERAEAVRSTAGANDNELSFFLHYSKKINIDLSNDLSKAKNTQYKSK